jgi:hypothetical protein
VEHEFHLRSHYLVCTSSFSDGIPRTRSGRGYEDLPGSNVVFHVYSHELGEFWAGKRTAGFSSRASGPAHVMPPH